MRDPAKLYDLHVSENTSVSSIFDKSTSERVDVATTARLLGRGLYFLSSNRRERKKGLLSQLMYGGVGVG